MERFAALIDLPDTQMLVVLEEDEEDQDITNLKHTVIIDGMRVSVSLGFGGDAGYDKAEKLLNRVDLAYAEVVLRGIKQSVSELGK